MPEPDLTVVLRRIDEIHRELREGFRALERRSEQRARQREAMLQTLTRQMDDALARMRKLDGVRFAIETLRRIGEKLIA